ncbi:glutathione S-transferase N-terminal domain-containing protein [Ottowia thiooxydans]|uniref:Glutathione S-transferase n=1 Tax=Ottowia thiooxydans TaxID=219182 RepID=A0ABV2Q3F9_9BURK
MPPVLYTFRRCPYAMRARWAILVSGVEVQMQEVSLRNKPAAMLAASPKATVPVLVVSDGQVIDQSLDIMLWALGQHDPEQWLEPVGSDPKEMLELINACELDFKPYLDRYKYPTRYQSEWAPSAAASGLAEQEKAFSDLNFAKAHRFLEQLAQQLAQAPALSGQKLALADYAIVPFIRQMARHDRPRFKDSMVPALTMWMDRLLAQGSFEAVMKKPPGTSE